MSRIAPVISTVLNENKRAIALYKNTDAFAKAVLLALFSLGNNAVAERIAVKHGLKRFKLNWNYASFFALKCAVWSCRYVKHEAIRRSVFTSNGLRITDTMVLEDINRLNLTKTIYNVKLYHRPDIYIAGELCNEITKILRPAFLNYARKKLSFIVKFYHDKSFDDLSCAMMEKAIYAFYRAYPLKSKTHILNSMRVAGYKFGLNIIEFQQRGKRREIDGGLTEGAEGYTVAKVGLDDTIKNSGSNGEEQHIHDVLASPNNDFELFEYNKFLESCTNRQKKVVKLLSMEDDIDFMLYLREKNPNLGRIYKADSAYRVLGNERYKKMVRKFVKMNIHKFDKFIDNLKSVVS